MTSCRRNVRSHEVNEELVFIVSACDQCHGSRPKVVYGLHHVSAFQWPFAFLSECYKTDCSVKITQRNNNGDVKKGVVSIEPPSTPLRNEKVEKTPIKSIKQSEVARLKQELELSQKTQQKKDEKITELEEKLTTVDKQMGELECNNFDLQDRIHHLEETLNQSVPSRSLSLVAEETEICPETLQVKNKYIEQLEKEAEQLKMDMKKLKIRCKRKLRSLNAQLSESKQVNSVEKMERELNLESKHIRPDGCGGSHLLIVELSSKVNEQETEIAELTHKIAEKDKEIAELSRPTDRNLAALPKSDSPSSQIRRWTSSCVSDIINNAALLFDNTAQDLPSSDVTDSLSKEKSRLSSAGTSTWSSEDDEVKSTDTHSLDPASIRRISAPKDRRRRTKPTQHRCVDEVKFTETEDLIKSLEHKTEMPAVY
ncbi:hypothetical protein CAPTEDRAFT_225377 [Capitella teleta]|uniref:Uncharacterized protein n=1 Tax=Capitella teleta TaxID=283909 RepID=R7U7N1_CAPTE|nr:hypothetical protein CAPTEDRAFT_225377 [Capitella teleta]|eukprot:ELU02375.1 hypothetical protein CAPTEDRAFT_225377 [Capitella teleta]